jgi:hypothetical protein
MRQRPDIRGTETRNLGAGRGGSIVAKLSYTFSSRVTQSKILGQKDHQKGEFLAMLLNSECGCYCRWRERNWFWWLHRRGYERLKWNREVLHSACRGEMSSMVILLRTRSRQLRSKQGTSQRTI